MTAQAAKPLRFYRIADVEVRGTREWVEVEASAPVLTDAQEDALWEWTEAEYPGFEVDQWTNPDRSTWLLSREWDPENYADDSDWE